MAATDRALSTEDRFLRELVGLARDEQRKVLRALSDLRRDPMVQSKPLKGAQGIFRRRVDAYRLLFALAPSWVHVYSVQHRRSIYEGEIAQPRATPSVDAPKWPPAPEDEMRPTSDREEISPARDDIDWESIARVVINRDAEDLRPLIDFGLPEDTFDELYSFLLREKAEATEHPRNVHIIRENVIDEFFGRLMLLPAKSRPTDLLIVSPWLTPWEGPKSSFAGVVRTLSKSLTPTTVVTRPPRLAQHERCVSELIALKNVEVVLLDDLHAKFFVCDLAPVPFALVGSANSTAQSFANYEIGVFVRGSGEAEAVVRDLQSLAIELRAAGRRVKRRAFA